MKNVENSGQTLSKLYFTCNPTTTSSSPTQLLGLEETGGRKDLKK